MNRQGEREMQVVSWIMILIKALVAVSAGDLVVNALDYSLTKKQVIGNAVLLLVLFFLLYVLEKYRVREDGKKKSFSDLQRDIFFYLILFTAMAVVLEIHFSLQPPIRLGITLMILLLLLLAEKRRFFGFAGEDRKNTGKLQLVFATLGYGADIALGCLAMIIFRKESDRYYLYIAVALTVFLAVILRQLGRGGKAGESSEREAELPEEEDGFPVAPERNEGTPEPDYDSWEYWEKKILTDRKEYGKRQLVLSLILTAAVTVLLCFMSLLCGLVFLLGAFLAQILIPMAFYRWGTGGTDVVRDKTCRTSGLVLRCVQLIVFLLGAWQLSYGAIWEIEYLSIVAAVIVGEGYLIRENPYVIG